MRLTPERTRLLSLIRRPEARFFISEEIPVGDAQATPADPPASTGSSRPSLRNPSMS